MSHKGRFERQKPQKKGGRIALIVLAVVAALLIAAVIGGVVYYNSMLNKINKAQTIIREPSPEDLTVPTGGDLEELTYPPETQPTETEPVETEPEETTRPPMKPEDIINVLVIGQAARAGEDARMADSNILVTINKYTNTVRLTSIFRDAYVHRSVTYSGNGKTMGGIKFTSVYAMGYKWGDIGGAMECMNLAVKNNFGVEVDYDVEVDFDLVMNFINKLGGVRLELTQAEADYMNQTMQGYYEEFKEGYNYMDGYMTLTYARMRKAEGDGESDIKRTGRQRYLIERIIHEMKKKSLTEIQELINETLPYITTNMENSEITKLAMDLIPMLANLTIESGTLPAEGTYSGKIIDIYDDGIPDSVLQFNPDQQKQIMAPIAEGIFD